jgi:hypothetical protein
MFGEVVSKSASAYVIAPFLNPLLNIHGVYQLYHWDFLQAWPVSPLLPMTLAGMGDSVLFVLLTKALSEQVRDKGDFRFEL